MSRYPFAPKVKRNNQIKVNEAKPVNKPAIDNKESQVRLREEKPKISTPKNIPETPVKKTGIPRLNVPAELEGYIEVEDCTNFKVQRYYVTEDVKKLYEDILSLQALTNEMQSLGIDYLNTTLLFGPPGTGKTHFCKYLAYRLNLPFVYINFAKIMGGGFGETSKNINAVFRFIAKERCVFMLDEIDCVTAKRSAEGNGTSGELNRITITVMQELDYYKSHRVNSIILGATNRLDSLDEALLSRFAIKHKMEPLSNKEKEGYIAMYMDDIGIPYDKDEVEEYCSENFDLEQRNMESDMVQAIARWIGDGKKGIVHIHHIT